MAVSDAKSRGASALKLGGNDGWVKGSQGGLGPRCGSNSERS